jgi:2'-5' RNA ligase/8-oxo-dGTP pyrophosphatase MutT (NUDIX family)
MSKTLTELFTTASEHSPEWIAEWGGGAQKPCPCCKGTGEHDEGECQLCDGALTVSEHTPDDAKGRDCFRTASQEGSVRMAAPEEYRKFHYPDYPQVKGGLGGLVRHFKKTDPDYYDKVKSDVQANGIKTPILVKYKDPRGNDLKRPQVMEGHHRAAVAHELGIHLPVGDYDNEHDFGRSRAGNADWFQNNQRTPKGISWEASLKTALPGEESQHTPGPVGLPDEKSYTHDQGVHRGVSIVLSPEKHKFVHDPAQPAPAKAHLLLSELKKQNAKNEGPEGEEGSTGGLGNYWSPSPDKGAEYAAQGGFKAYHDHERAHNCGDEDTGDGGCPTTQVVVHADTPAEKDHWHERFRQGEKYDPAISWRLPVRPGAKMNVQGVSWREGNDHKSSDEKYSEEGMKHHTQTPFSRYDFAAPVRKEAGVSFGPGGHMGEPSYEEGDGYSKGRWDEWHPKLQPEIHRHIALDLPGSHPAHNDKLPLEERARAVLQDTLTKGNVGVHWTDDQNYKHLTGPRLEAGQTPVILHAKTPPRDHVEDNDYVLEDRAVRDWDTQEREVPLKRNAPVHVTGITWHTPRGGAVRHNFEQPFRVHAVKSPDEVTCDQGHTHWGERGGAGLLTRHTDLEGTHHYLLQQRSQHVDHPGTWSTPGGMMEAGESPFTTAVREGTEELGDLPPLGHIGTHSNDHGGWSYHTVIADSPTKFTPDGEGTHAHETAGHGWFTAPQIDAMGESGKLHSGFAESWPEVRHRAETEVPHRQMRLFASSKHAPAGIFGTDNEGHRVQMTPMDGWAHDDGSHGHEDNTTIGDHPVYTETHTWLPSGRYWGPNSAQNDQRLFEGDHLRPEIRSDVLDRVGGVLRPHYKDWAKWARVYFAGSEAARWQPFNGDFDILIGIDWPEFHKANPGWEGYPDAGIAAGMTDHFWMEPEGNVKDYWFTLQDGRKVGPFDRTFFVNPKAWDIRELHPYAAYNVTDDDWAVHPLEVPADWDATHLPESYWTYAESLLHEIRAIGQLPEEERHRMASNLWDQIHTHRSDAFTDGGHGLFDLSNVVEKYLDQHPDHPWAQLTQWKNEAPDQPMAPVRGNLSGLFSEGAAKGADGNGIMIAIVPPEKVGKKLLVEDGEPLEALHVTLCYLGSRKEHPKGKVESLPSLVRAWARTQKPFEANIGGAGTFTNPGSHVLWAAVDIPGGGEIRQSLSDLLEEHGYKVRNDHGWTPHITLKYHNSHVRFLPKVEPATWKVGEVMLCIGGDWEPIELGA